MQDFVNDAEHEQRVRRLLAPDEEIVVMVRGLDAARSLSYVQFATLTTARLILHTPMDRSAIPLGRIGQISLRDSAGGDVTVRVLYSGNQSETVYVASEEQAEALLLATAL